VRHFAGVDRFDHDVPTVLAAYNAGEKAVLKNQGAARDARVREAGHAADEPLSGEELMRPRSNNARRTARVDSSRSSSSVSTRSAMLKGLLSRVPFFASVRRPWSHRDDQLKADSASGGSAGMK